MSVDGGGYLSRDHASVQLIYCTRGKTFGQIISRVAKVPTIFILLELEYSLQRISIDAPSFSLNQPTVISISSIPLKYTKSYG